MKGLPHGVADALQSATYSQRALAYLQVDAELTLVGAGGNLENYGLAAVQLGQSALDQAFFLEGLLPLVETPPFLPSVGLNGGSGPPLHFFPDGTWRRGGAAGIGDRGGGGRRGGGGGRGRQSREIDISRHHEPRNPHANEWRAGYGRSARAAGPQRGPATHRGDDTGIGAGAAAHHR